MYLAAVTIIPTPLELNSRELSSGENSSGGEQISTMNSCRLNDHKTGHTIFFGKKSNIKPKSHDAPLTLVNFM